MQDLTTERLESDQKLLHITDYGLQKCNPRMLVLIAIVQ